MSELRLLTLYAREREREREENEGRGNEERWKR